MAIGSEPEIGAGFRTEFDSYEERLIWLRDWRERVGPDLLIGYGTLDYPPRGKDYEG